MVVVVGDVSCSVLLLAVVCCDGPLRGGLAGGRVEDSNGNAVNVDTVPRDGLLSPARLFLLLLVCLQGPRLGGNLILPTLLTPDSHCRISSPAVPPASFRLVDTLAI